MTLRPVHLLVLAALCCLLALPMAPAQAANTLADAINAYRGAAAQCDGMARSAVAPLRVEPALNNLPIAAGRMLDQTLAKAGYRAAHAQVIIVNGSSDVRIIMSSLVQNYCSSLGSAGFSAMGIGRDGESWVVVLAQPAPPSPLERMPATRETGMAILAAVNAARTHQTYCGAQHFDAAPALAWNDALAEAALAHSSDMARQRYFNHQGKDGRMVGERALQAGYRWRGIGENIAVGQTAVAEVVAGWMASPGHCANIMQPAFSEMGAAYAINRSGEQPRAYWTQVFGAPRP
ncbi:MAG: CAP domain-containing protein [Massilia sp.]